MGIIPINKTMDTSALLNRKLTFFMYDEITLFFVNLIILLLLFCTGPETQAQVLDILTDSNDPEYFVIIWAGFLSAFYLPLVRENSKLCKGLAGFYIAMISFMVAMETYTYSLAHQTDPLVRALSILNVLPSAIVLVAMRMEYLSPEDLITSRQAKRRELLVGLILVPALFAYSSFYLQHGWVETFSLCLFYTVFINNLIIRLLPGVDNEMLQERFAPDARVRRNDRVAKLFLVVVFFAGIGLWISYLAKENRELAEERRRNEAAVAAENEQRFGIGLSAPHYFDLARENRYTRDYAQSRYRGELLNVVGVIRPAESAKIPQRVTHPRVAFIDESNDQQPDGIGYYTLCDDSAAGRVGEMVNIFGMIDVYDLYGTSGVTANCLRPKSALDAFDTGELRRIASQSFDNQRARIFRAVDKFIDDPDARQVIAYGSDRCDSLSYHRLATNNAYALLCGHDLSSGQRLYLSFTIEDSGTGGQRIMSTDELDIFIADKL